MTGIGFRSILFTYKPKAPAGATQGSPGWSAAEPWDIFEEIEMSPGRGGTNLAFYDNYEYMPDPR